MPVINFQIVIGKIYAKRIFLFFNKIIRELLALESIIIFINS